MTNMNPDGALAELWAELKTVVQKHEDSELPEVRKSAIFFGKVIDIARAPRDIAWASNTLADVLRDMLDKAENQDAVEFLKAVGVVVAGVFQVQERGGKGHTLVLVDEEEGKVRVQAQKYGGHASGRA